MRNKFSVRNPKFSSASLSNFKTQAALSNFPCTNKVAEVRMLKLVIPQATKKEQQRKHHETLKYRVESGLCGVVCEPRSRAAMQYELVYSTPELRMDLWMTMCYD